MELFSDANRRNPYPLYDQIRTSLPLLREPTRGMWMVFDYEGVRRVLSDPETFSSRAAPGGGKPLEWMIFMDPPRHTKLRAIVARAFTPRVIAGLEGRIAEISRGLIDRFVGRGEVDLAAEYSVPLPTMVIAEMLGIPSEDWPRFKRWSDAILLLSDTVSGTPDDAARAGAAFMAARAEMSPYVAGVLERRRTEPADDLLTRLATAEVDGQRLTDQEILGFFQLLLLAGNETTTNLINNAVLCFAENPGELARVRADMKLLPRAIEEVLRYRSPLQAAFRVTLHDAQVHGKTIPAGSLVLTMIGSANRDPKQFAEPARFDVTRDPNPHVAFGHGAHFCMGAPLSRLEARVALTDLLGRLPRLELAVDGPWEPRRAFHVHGPTRLPVRFGAR